jgi:hypothetical protein
MHRTMSKPGSGQNWAVAHEAGLSRGLLDACATAGRTCGDECEQHAEMNDHCRICADACRACERACRDLLTTMS